MSETDFFSGFDDFEPFKPRCRKCWAYLDFEDEVCRECGTPRGEGAFDAEDNEPAEVYGPPDVLEARRAALAAREIPPPPSVLYAPPDYLGAEGPDPWDTGAFDDSDDDDWD